MTDAINKGIRDEICDAVRRNVDAMALSGRTMPQAVRVNVLYPHSHVELIVDLGEVVRKAGGAV